MAKHRGCSALIFEAIFALVMARECRGPQDREIARRDKSPLTPSTNSVSGLDPRRADPYGIEAYDLHRENGSKSRKSYVDRRTNAGRGFVMINGAKKIIINRDLCTQL